MIRFLGAFHAESLEKDGSAVVMSVKRSGLWGGLAVLLLGSVAVAEVGRDIEWLDETCFRVGPIQSCKPSKNWDTQKTKDYNAKFKFVLHRSGANPVCWLRFDENPAGKTAHDYASSLRARYQQRGLTQLSQRRQVIAGRDVFFLGARDSRKGFRYLVGVWRNRTVGINLECTAPDKDFSTYEPQFKRFVSSSRIVSESRD